MNLVIIKFDKPLVTSAKVVGGYLDDQLVLCFNNKDMKLLAEWLVSIGNSINFCKTPNRVQPEEMKTIVVSMGEAEVREDDMVYRGHQTNIMYENVWPIRLICEDYSDSFTMIFNYSRKSTKFYYYKA